VLTTAGPVPAGATPDQVVTVTSGRLSVEGRGGDGGTGGP
jgi:hypothetical protein